MMNQLVNGEEALAQAAIDEGTVLATGYPGSPGGGIISILEATNNSVDAHWSTNEKIGLEKAIGVAINGEKALVCVKSVGLNAMLDPLTVVNLTPLTGALVIVVGDDPGGYGSQNDQDSRSLSLFLNLPWFEPADPSSGYTIMRIALKVSTNFGLPVFIRITRSFSLQKQKIYRTEPILSLNSFDLQHPVLPRFVPMPANAVAKNQELIDRMFAFKQDIPSYNLNETVESSSKIGLVVCGHLISKLRKLVELKELSKYAKIILIQHIYPINETGFLNFLSGLEKVIILEENMPFISNQLKTIAWDSKAHPAWKSITHPGEMFQWQIVSVLKKEFTSIVINPDFDQTIDERPKLKSNCTNSRYNEVLDMLDACAKKIGKKINYYGDPGCLVAVGDRLQGKYAMGGSVATAFGANKVKPSEINLALIGDSGFFHSALPAIIDASYHNTPIPMILLNNGSALTTGKQYHPGVTKNDLKQRLDYELILKGCGIGQFQQVNFNQKKEEIEAVLISFLKPDKTRLLQIDID